jgi:ribosomal protein L40E
MAYCPECGTTNGAEAKYCTNCGTKQILKDKPTKKAVKSQKLAPSSYPCPICGESDSCQKIASIVDSGNSVSVGLSTFTTWSLDPVMGSGVNVNASSTNLARRLSVAVPEAKFQLQWFFTGMLLAIIIVYQWAKQGNSGDSLLVALFFSIAMGLIPGALLGVVLGFVVKAIEARKMEPFRIAAVKAQQEARKSYYCFRDDIAFNDVFSDSPELFMQELVRKFQG